MEILIGGDFCVTPTHINFDLIDNEIVQLFKKSDLNVVNLECPVTKNNHKNKILKTGPFLRTDEAIFNHLKKIDVDIVTLANNHILDYGEIGLKETIEHCIKNEVKFVGAGKDINEAAKYLVIEKDGLKISFVNFCENEWSIATNDSFGANPMDTIDNYKQIFDAKANSDFVIVIVHGGHEYYSLPSPRMQKQYRFYIDSGANAVIGHHTHTVSGYEVYKKAPIFYSLGNFLFTESNTNKEWYNGILIKLILKKENDLKWEVFPINQSNNYYTQLIEGNKRDLFFDHFNENSKIIKDENALLKHWEEFTINKIGLLDSFSPINYIGNKYLKLLIRKLKLNKILVTKKNKNILRNIIRCEAHRELVLELLKNTSK